jgi:UDP-N-acetylglucosamine 2-epimerase
VNARLRVLSVLGSRPEVIQARPLAAAFASRFDEILLDTGQHYDWEMAEGQMLDTRLPKPAYSLGIGSLPDLEQLRAFEDAIAAVIEAERPAVVIVRGDTNSTLAGARAARAAGVPLVHVEAGMRSYRSDMPEERNRVETDQLADLLCAPTATAAERLLAEDVPGTVVTTGDVLFDMLLETRDRLPARSESEPYVLATVHRNYNTDDPVRLAAVMDCLAAVPGRVLLPLHPRTRERLTAASLQVPPNVEVTRPATYTQMLALERDADAIVTDSGGVQREAYFWGVPCVTLREETEWVETVTAGWNVLAGADAAAVADALARELPGERPPIFGDGRASARIADAVGALLAELQAVTT